MGSTGSCVVDFVAAKETLPLNSDSEVSCQLALQPTEYDVLYDFRVLWQSPRSSKLLQNLTLQVDTVEVCGSSPHGPTISFNGLEEKPDGVSSENMLTVIRAFA